MRSKRVFAVVCLAGVAAWTASKSEDWHAIKANLDLPVNAVGGEDEEEDAAEIVRFYGLSLEADALVFLLCGRGELWTSGEFEVARRELLRSIRELSVDAELAIVYYNYKGPELFPTQGNPVKADAEGKAAAESFLNKLKWDGEFLAWMEQPFQEAFALADKVKGKKKRIVYVSDGNDVVDKPKVLSVADGSQVAAEIAARITAMNKKRVPVDCVNVDKSNKNPDACEARFLRNLANLNDGQYKAAPSAEAGL